MLEHTILENELTKYVVCVGPNVLKISAVENLNLLLVWNWIFSFRSYFLYHIVWFRSQRHCLRKLMLLHLFYCIFYSNSVNNVVFYLLCLVSWSQTKLGSEWFLAIKIQCIRQHLSSSSLHFAFIVYQSIKINSGLGEFHKKITIGRHLAANRWSVS